MSAYEGALNSAETSLISLWDQYVKSRGDASREKLFLHYQPLAQKICMSFYGRFAPVGVSVDDLRQCAYIGLLSAIENYDPSRMVKFNTYASIRIKGEMLNGLKHYSEWSDLYQHRKKLAQERIQSVLEAGNRPGNRPGSKRGGWDTGNIVDLALDLVLISILECEDEQMIYSPNEESISINRLLSVAVSRLSKEHQEVIKMHYYYEASFSVIGEALGATKSAVYHHHRQALKALREELLSLGKKEIYL